VATYVMLWFQDQYLSNEEAQSAPTPEPENSVPEPPPEPCTAPQGPSRAAPTGERPPRDEPAS
jgi:hypothetical protein